MCPYTEDSWRRNGALLAVLRPLLGLARGLRRHSAASRRRLGGALLGDN